MSDNGMDDTTETKTGAGSAGGETYEDAYCDGGNSQIDQGLRDTIRPALPNKRGPNHKKHNEEHKKVTQKGRVFVPFAAAFCAFCVPSPISWAKRIRPHRPNGQSNRNDESDRHADLRCTRVSSARGQEGGRRPGVGYRVVLVDGAIKP